MPIQHFLLSKKRFFVYLAGFCALSLKASSLVFFERTVDFYGNGEPINASQQILNESSTTPEPHTESIRSLDKNPFEWKHYSDPNDSQFWDAGGDFIPSLPWRYFMTHPTAENAKKYQEWMNTKMALTQTASKMLVKNPVLHFDDKNNSIEKSGFKTIDWSHFTVAFFYRTSCTYCEKSAPVFEFIQQHGGHMVSIQLDATERPPALADSIPYDQKMDEVFHVSATPTWIIQSLTEQKPIRIEGYASVEKIESLVQAKI